MRRIIPLILLMLLFLGTLPYDCIKIMPVSAQIQHADAVQANPMQINWAYPTYVPGDVFTVYVDVINVVDLASFQCGFRFNATALQVLNVQEGGFLSDNGADPLLSFPGFIDNVNGTVGVYGWTVLDPSSQARTGSGSLLRITMQINPTLWPPYTDGYPGGPVPMINLTDADNDPCELILMYEDLLTEITPTPDHIYSGTFTLSVTPRNPVALMPIIDTFTTVMDSNTTTWDTAGIVEPYVIYDAGLYKMWYTAQSEPQYWPPYWVLRWVIAYAESNDGIVWVNKTVCHDTGGPSYYYTGSPWVLKESGVYRMWHMDSYEWVAGDWSTYIAHMTSADGVTWPGFMSADDTKVMSALGQTEPQGDGNSVWLGCVLYEPSTGYTMYYAVADHYGTGQYGPSKIWRATSNDGIAWSNRQLSLPYIPGTWEGNIEHPSVVREDDGTFTMFYGAYTQRTWCGDTIGMAESVDGLNWVNRTQLLKPSDLGSNITGVSTPFHFRDLDGKRYLYFSYYDNGDERMKFGRIQLASPRIVNLDTNLAYSTIQSAIDAPETQSGHTIFVRNGTYYENVVVNKTVSLIGENKYATIIDGSGTGVVISVTTNNVRISGFTVQNSGTELQESAGIMLFGASSNNIISDNIVKTGVVGIRVRGPNNTVSGNIVTDHTGWGIVSSSNNSTISGNTATNNFVGLHLQFCSNNTFRGNTAINNYLGIYPYYCSNNSIYHNNIINNTWQVYNDESYNTWDNGYPSGGNHWSDYTGVDLYSGPYQNETGSDGIGDTPYLDERYTPMRDNYPLMKPYSGLYDIGIIDITTSKTIIGQGYSLNITIKTLNYGVDTQTFNLTVYANSTIIKTIKNVILTSRSSTTLTLTWNTTGFAKGNYTITAYAWPIQNETDIADNTYTDGIVKVTIPGDVNGDFFVNIKDAAQVGMYWGKTVPPAPANVDINGDGIINIKDAAIIGINWQKHA
jgi:parallel beta-helix repeat protein